MSGRLLAHRVENSRRVPSRGLVLTAPEVAQRRSDVRTRRAVAINSERHVPAMRCCACVERSVSCRYGVLDVTAEARSPLEVATSRPPPSRRRGVPGRRDTYPRSAQIRARRRSRSETRLRTKATVSWTSSKSASRRTRGSRVDADAWRPSTPRPRRAVSACSGGRRRSRRLARERDVEWHGFARPSTGKAGALVARVRARRRFTRASIRAAGRSDPRRVLLREGCARRRAARSGPRALAPLQASSRAPEVCSRRHHTKEDHRKREP